MKLCTEGYAIIDLPAASSEILATFHDLPIDPYSGGNHRYRRFSQYRMSFKDESWYLELLPHRPFIQSKEYNVYVGGIPRHLEPLKIDPTLQIDAGAKAIPLDISKTWQVNVHQCRVITDRSIRGISVPEGPHRDGHEFGMLAVFERYRITGGENQLMPSNGGEPFFRTVLEKNQALIYDDGRMFHMATDIEPIGDELGYRHLWIVAFNQWENRRYGPEFEKRAVLS
jgi:hypothetical protein